MVKTDFTRRCDKLRKQVINAVRDLASRTDSPFMNRSGKKILGPLQSEFDELCQMAVSPEQLEERADEFRLFGKGRD